MEMILTRNFVKSLKEEFQTSGIYKIINPKGKIYIGQSIDLYRRLNSYCESNSAKNQTILKHSFNKYGRQNHKFKILEKCDVEELNIKERYWQEFYKDNLLNCRFTKSNDKSGYCLEETKIKISKALKSTDKSWKHLKKKIYQYSNEGLFIKEWESVRKASRELNISLTTIVKSAKGNGSNKSAGGFLWSYNYLEKLEGRVGQDKIKIQQFDLRDNLVNEWYSISEAAEKTNTSKSSIIRCCKNKQKTANGFLWKYLYTKKHV